MILDDPTQLTSEEARATSASWMNAPLIGRPSAPERVTRALNSLALQPIPPYPVLPNSLSEVSEMRRLIEYAPGNRSEVLRPNGGVGLTDDTTHYLHNDETRRSAQIAIDWGADGRASRTTLFRALYCEMFPPEAYIQQPFLESEEAPQ